MSELSAKVESQVEQPWYPRPVDLLAEDTVSNQPMVGMSGPDPEVDAVPA